MPLHKVSCPNLKAKDIKKKKSLQLFSYLSLKADDVFLQISYGSLRGLKSISTTGVKFMGGANKEK